MSLNDDRVEHVSQQILYPENSLTDSSTDCNSTPYKRRRQTNQALDVLGQLMKDHLKEDLDGKLNKNDTLSLTVSRLLRRKYLPFNLVNSNIPLTSGLEISTPGEEFNGFFIVLNSSGRILFISDDAEHYLRKNVRALYSQLTTIYQCVHEDSHENIQRVLSRQQTDEQHLLCTWNLPRGKRPSRAHTESKAMLITGHYFYLHADKSRDQQEPLFLARCEQVLSSTPNIPSNNRGMSSATTLRFVLNDQFQINEISTNTQTVLGFTAEELIDQSLKRFLASEHWTHLDQARENCILGQHCTTMNVIDLYTRTGDRLTFLCNIHLLMENRRKSLKFGFLAQLIDPSMRDDFLHYANKQNTERLKTIVPQESILLSNLYQNECSTQSSGQTSLVVTDRNFQGHSIGTVCSANILPQRRKRRRIITTTTTTEPTIKEERSYSMDCQLDESRSLNHDSTSSDSPRQEIGSVNGLYSFFDEFFAQENFKILPDFSLVDEFNEFFTQNSSFHSSFGLLTPTLPPCSFFA